MNLNKREDIYQSLGISRQVLAFGEAVLDELQPRFRAIDETAEKAELRFEERR